MRSADFGMWTAKEIDGPSAYEPTTARVGCALFAQPGFSTAVFATEVLSQIQIWKRCLCAYEVD